MNDDTSLHTMLHPCCNADNDAVTTETTKWITCVGCMEWWVTDQDLHLVASLINYSITEARVDQLLTTPLSPWGGGAFQRLRNGVARASQALLSKWKLRAYQWPSIVWCQAECDQSIFYGQIGRECKRNDKMYYGTVHCFEAFNALPPFKAADTI